MEAPSLQWGQDVGEHRRPPAAAVWHPGREARVGGPCDQPGTEVPLQFCVTIAQVRCLLPADGVRSPPSDRQGSAEERSGCAQL